MMAEEYGKDDSPWIIAGLGNPGRKYVYSRHNVGFRAVDRIASDIGMNVRKVKFKSLIGEGLFHGNRIILVKPQTFMNLSGEAIFDVVRWYKPNLSRLFVVYDDADLDLGRLRIRKSGSAGTHNGMRSIIQLLGREDFPRIRIGIGKAPEGYDMADYVLSTFDSGQGVVMDKAVEDAAKAAVHVIMHGIDSAMGTYNTTAAGSVEDV